MRAAKFFASVLLVLSPLASMAANEVPIDKALVGEWRGQHDAKPGCKFESHTIKRLPDGRFVISYFSDAAQTRQVSEIKGLWWAADQTLFMQTPGSGNKPEAYRYYMVDRNTVRMENVDVDLSAECPDDSTQVDTRVVMQQD